jgi:hypothetical protein
VAVVRGFVNRVVGMRWAENVAFMEKRSMVEKSEGKVPLGRLDIDGWIIMYYLKKI